MSTIAQNVINKFGGFHKLAEILEMEVSWIYRWTYPKDRGGTGGFVPSRQQPILLSKANELGIDLSPADFFIAQSLNSKKPIKKTRS